MTREARRVTSNSTDLDIQEGDGVFIAACIVARNGNISKQIASVTDPHIEGSCATHLSVLNEIDVGTWIFQHISPTYIESRVIFHSELHIYSRGGEGATCTCQEMLALYVQTGRRSGDRLIRSSHLNIAHVEEIRTYLSSA